MKSEKVLKLLKCTRQTLSKYVKEGKIKINKLDNGYYEYCDENIYGLLSNYERQYCFYTKLIKNINSLKCYNDYYEMLDDLLEYNIKQLTVYGYEINNIELLHYLCNKYGCQLVIM